MNLCSPSSREYLLCPTAKSNVSCGSNVRSCLTSSININVWLYTSYTVLYYQTLVVYMSILDNSMCSFYQTLHLMGSSLSLILMLFDLFLEFCLDIYFLFNLCLFIYDMKFVVFSVIVTIISFMIYYYYYYHRLIYTFI